MTATPAEWNRKRVLVTGGAGFIGSHLAERLVMLGAEVVVIDDLSTGHAANLPDGVELHEGSILDDTLLTTAIAGCTYVFHKAAMVSVPQSVEVPARCVEINVTGTFKLLMAARAAGVGRVVFASSSAVYGDEPSLPSRETDPIDARSPYAASKAAGEAWMSAFARVYDISTVSLRYFNVYGPRQDPSGPYAAVIAAFAKALAEGRSPTIYGDGTQTRDFVSVMDVVEANLLAATCPKPLAGEAINIGSGHAINLLEVLAAMAGERDVSPVFAAARAGDVLHSQPSLECARGLLGYEPAVRFGVRGGRGPHLH